MTEGITLADAIEHLRAELEVAAQRGSNHVVRFDLGTVTLTLDVSVTRSLEAGGGVRFWVVNADVGGSRAIGQTQRVEVQLTPVIGGVRNPRIASEQTEPE